MNAFVPTNAAVWFEIPVSDQQRSKDFYAAVTGNPLEDEAGGPNAMARFTAQGEASVSGHIYPGKPAASGTGPTIHLAVNDVDAAVARVAEAGGKVVSPVVSIPAGRFAYCLDLDGNSFGVFSS